MWRNAVLHRWQKVWKCSTRRFGHTISAPSTHARTDQPHKKDEPLRILFCGSDDFSCASLRALHKWSREPDSNILSIDVATRTNKRVGRGLKQISVPPIKDLAQEIDLRCHQFDTFTGWNLPDYSSRSVPYINLVIAVSFGLLVPPRILNQVKFGGLNVHPSLLPDLKGSAPLQWAIIRGYRTTGISVQTLHPSKFDEGVILSQTVDDPVEIPEGCTYEQLAEKVAPRAASQLVEVIKHKLYTKPHDAFVRPKSNSIYHNAPKITMHHMQMDLFADDAETIVRKCRALPKLYAEALHKSRTAHHLIRINFGRDLRLSTAQELPADLARKIRPLVVGQPFAILANGEDITTTDKPIFIPTRDGKFLVAPRLLVAGGREGPAARAASGGRLFRKVEELSNNHSIYVFHEWLNGVGANIQVTPETMATAKSMHARETFHTELIEQGWVTPSLSSEALTKRKGDLIPIQITFGGDLRKASSDDFVYLGVQAPEAMNKRLFEEIMQCTRIGVPFAIKLFEIEDRLWDGPLFLRLNATKTILIPELMVGKQDGNGAVSIAYKADLFDKARELCDKTYLLYNFRAQIRKINKGSRVDSAPPSSPAEPPSTATEINTGKDLS